MSNAVLETTDADYDQIVVDTFLNRAVRTALLIDDRYPTLAEMVDDPQTITEKFAEAPRAARLYRMFRKRHILCDVENQAAKVRDGDGIERIRKSDLVVLDYHLNQQNDDSSDAIDIIMKLADTPHFNIVVLFTAATDLTEIWINVAGSLRGGWDLEELLSDSQLEQWDSMDEAQIIESVTRPLLIEAITNFNGITRSHSAKEMRKNLEQHGVKKGDCSNFIKKAVSRAFSKNVAPSSLSKDPKTVRGECAPTGAKWLLCGNVFVVILKKETDAELGAEDDPEYIFDGLSKALIAWHPNILQIILSEIQNVLEMKAVASDEVLLGDESLQAGLIHYVLSHLPLDAESSSDHGAQPAVELLIGKLLEGVRRRIDQDSTLIGTASQLIAARVASPDWRNLPLKRGEREKALLGLSRSIAGVSRELGDEDVIFSLNVFLATERFRRRHVTTGTIFMKKDNGREWWLCMSPSCDMTPRQPQEGHHWHHTLHPLRGMVALRLEPVIKAPTALRKDLQNAHHGRSIFVRTADCHILLKVLDDNSHPSWEFMILENAGLVSKTKSGDTQFSARRIWFGGNEAAQCAASNEIGLQPSDFVVVGQLRAEYASRLLQATGLHLSRIGVDFVSLPENS